MKKKLHTKLSKLKATLLILIFSICTINYAQVSVITIPEGNKTFSAGSFIINMGVTPQTVANGLKPYGLVYALLSQQIPVNWVINQSKTKDGADFTYNGVNYSGGTFVIDGQYLSSAAKTVISTWQGLGVIGTYSTSPFIAPVYNTFTNAPRWTMDSQKGSIIVPIFANAGIPPVAYGGTTTSLWKTPSQLNCCDDVFVMPHADPIWSTHKNLYDFVIGTGDGISTGCRSGVWMGCHAGSALHDMFDNITTDGDPIDFAQQANFLSAKTGNAVGAGPYSENSLLLWGNHDNGTPPFSYDFSTDPIMQFIGSLDAATQGGSEQIYVPKSAGWFPTTKVGVYDPDHADRYLLLNDPKYRAAVLAYGPAFGNLDNGKLMLEGGHNIVGTAPANIAAQRAFLNYSFLVAWEKAVNPSLDGLASQIFADQIYNMGYNLAFNMPPIDRNFTISKITWSSSCGGTFSSPNGATTTYFPPPITSDQTCNLSVMIEDQCGRKTFDTHTAVLSCRLDAVASLVNPCFNTPNGGTINLNITYGVAPYKWTWTRTEGGTGSGSGTSITGLAAGTYNITVTDRDGTGCSDSFSAILTQSPEINVTATPVHVKCNGDASGSIDINVTGGLPGYTYLWNDGITTPNRSGLTSGTYTVTVTDSKGCITNSSVTISQPTLLSIAPTITNVNCYGENSGAITMAVTGGVTPYTYLWNDGVTTQNRTNVAEGNYSVTVTDANGCIKTSTATVSQPSAALSTTFTKTDVLCNGASTGSINLIPAGGTSPYTYAWVGPNSFTASTEDLSNIKAGTYTVTVTDAKGCKTTQQIVISEPVAIAIAANITSPTCPPTATQNNADGAIVLTVSNGTPIYSYSWTGPNSFTASTKDISGLIAGTYTVMVTDSNGCAKTASFVLNYLNPILPPPGSITR